MTRNDMRRIITFLARTITDKLIIHGEANFQHYILEHVARFFTIFRARRANGRTCDTARPSALAVLEGVDVARVNRPDRKGRVSRDVAREVQPVPMHLQGLAPSPPRTFYPPMGSRRSEFSWHTSVVSCSQLSSF